MDQTALKQQIIQGIRAWNNGKDHPLMQHANELAQAGASMPKGVDPLLPTLMALRETAGGTKTKASNNIFNQRDNTGAFVNYPDVKTAILGGVNPLYDNVHSSGFVGIINHDNPKNPDYYSDFRKSGDVADLWKHWSPPDDHNGTLPVQVDNYNWILNRMKSGLAQAPQQPATPFTAQAAEPSSPPVPPPPPGDWTPVVTSHTPHIMDGPAAPTVAPKAPVSGGGFDLGRVMNAVWQGVAHSAFPNSPAPQAFPNAPTPAPAVAGNPLMSAWRNLSGS